MSIHNMTMCFLEDTYMGTPSEPKHVLDKHMGSKGNRARILRSTHPFPKGPMYLYNRYLSLRGVPT